jgi:hypothetical protein
LKQYRVDDHELVKAYPFNTCVDSVIKTLDSKLAYVHLAMGSLHQICIDSQTVIKDYVEFYNHNYGTLKVTSDKYSLIMSEGTCVKKISIPDKKVVKDLGGITPQWITATQLAPGDQSLFVYDSG